MIGKQILHYRILDKIGEGGMGVVYKAEDTRLGRTVALKFMPPDVTRDNRSKRRFMREARTIAALDHPNLCTIHAIEETPDERLFIAMACYSGETLADRIERGPVDIDEAVTIAIAIADAMKLAHAAGIIHRDVKPANVFLVEGGPVKLVDFGLAKWQGASSITRSGVTLGTVAYMSPEQARGEEIDARTDVWALGAVLYEMLTGQRAFGGDYEQAILYSVLNTDPEPVSALREGVPGDLEYIVSRALIKSPVVRYQSADEILADLRDFRTKSGRGTDAGDGGGDVPSIAVLPFINMSSDPENDYFGDGLAEELINALAGWPGIRVAARTSAFSFRGREQDVRGIGRLLNVDHLLEGSVRKSGNRLRITVQLVETKTGYHLWSERFDRPMEDVFEIQDEITGIIFDRLRVKLTGAAEPPQVRRHTRDMEAYELYLKGLYSWHKFSPEGLEYSFRCFNETLDRDPDFAPAYVGLGMYHQAVGFWADVPPEVAFPAAKEAADRAIALDDSADARGLIAVHRFSYDWDFDAADAEMERTLELAPRSAINRCNYSVYLVTRGRFDQAMVEARKAAELDPLSQMIQTWSAMVPSYAGRWQQSIDELRKASELDLTYWQPYLHTAIAWLFGGEPDRAADFAEKALELSGGASFARMALVSASFLAGRKDRSDEVLDQMQHKAATAYFPPAYLTSAHLARGETDAAYECLVRAIKRRDPWLLFFNVLPRELTTTDSRFIDPLREVGLGP